MLKKSKKTTITKSYVNINLLLKLHPKGKSIRESHKVALDRDLLKDKFKMHFNNFLYGFMCTTPLM